MNTAVLAQSLYAKPTRELGTARGIEYKAFSKVTARLASWNEEKDSYASLVEAFCENQLLWSVLGAFSCFGNEGGSRVGESDFAQKVTEAYQVRQFEKAVGEGDNTMRLTLTLEREISKYAESSKPETVAWFQLLANPPLRQIFESAFGLPESVGQLDIDRQRGIFQNANDQLFGSKSMDVFKDPENVDKLLRNFVAREQINNGPGPLTVGMGALTLMENAVAAAASFASLTEAKFCISENSL